MDENAATATFASRSSAPGAAGDLDAELMRHIREGSMDALGTLYDRDAEAVHAAALRVLGDPAAAAEVVQDTFLAAWNRAELFDPSRGSLRAWLLTIARNRALDAVRRRERRGNSVPFSAFELRQDDLTAAEWLMATAAPVGNGQVDVGPDELLLTHEERASVRAALALLAPVERIVIQLAYREELSQAEIALRLGWPIGTVKTRTRRALRRLREALEGTTGAGDGRPVDGRRTRDEQVVGPATRAGSAA
jgi:RNA polymerase sigma-70 factor (ECF subfamily)